MSHRLLRMRHLPTVWVPLSNPCELPDTAPHSVHHTSIHVVSAEGDHDSPSLETRLMQWIIQAWLICSDVHYLFIEGLLALGQEVSKNSMRAFDDRRVALTCSLLSHCAEQNSNKHVVG
jgi:DNA repair exonuclease SbcCD nuclease subunit